MDFIALQRAKLHYVFENIFHVVERLVSEKEAEMNKIFKVIWSKSKQCYVVVSELAKNTTGKKKIVVASILAALIAGQVMQVDASGAIGNTNKKGALLINGHVSNSGGLYQYGSATEENAIAIGQNANATGRGGIALGNDTQSGHNGFAAAWNSQATGQNSTAVGTGTRATAMSATAVGDSASASQTSATAIGKSASASQTSATAIGDSAEASGSEATSFGVASTANKDGALAVGSHSTSSVKAGTAIGYNASVSYSGAGNSWGSTAIGAQTSVTGKNAVAIGRASKASGNNSLAIGAGNNDDGTASTEFAESTGTNSLAIGYNAKAKNISAVAVGKGAKAEGVASTALGETALADQDNDSALGNSVHASGGGSSAVGYLVTTSGNQAFGAGSNTTVSGGAAIGIGYMNSATGNRAISIGADNSGTNNTASGNYSVAIGAASQATNTNSTAVGTNSNATGEDSFAGASGKASGAASIAIGKSANAGGTTAAASSIAIGDNAAASGIGSTAVGKTALADTGNDSAFGNSSHASGGGSSAIGYLVTTSGNQAFGAGSNTTVSGTAAVGIGYSNEVTGDRAVAIGSSLNGVKTGASGTYGVAMGAASRALAEAATAIGKNTTSNGADSIAIGTAATSTTAASSAISVGKNAKTEDQNAVAIGVDSYAKTMDSIAIGNTAKATGLVSTALGARAEALGTSAVAVGINAKAKKDQATALGFNAQANETNSLALGYGASATVDNGVALGSGSKANVASGVAGYNANTENIARTDKYSGLTGVALNSNLGALSVGVTDATGAATSTRQIVGVAAGTADTDAVNVAQLKSVNLAFTGNSGSGDVNLSKSKLAVEGGTNSFITTTAANKKLEINTTQGTLKNTSGTVSVNGANGLAVAQNVADVINQSNADQTIKYKANGTGNNSVKLSDGLNFTNGTTTTATVGANGQVSFDLNTATQKSITDSAAAVARSISLGGDTGTTTAKSLSSANVNFGIKSGSPTYLTTVANGNDVTLTINEQAIKDAAKSASSFKVKANATVAEDVKGGDTVTFNDGDNIAITQTGKTFKIATAKNVTFDAATIGGNTTIGSTGITTNKVTVGTVSIDGTNGINAGGKAITHVGTGRVSNSSTDDGNVANIGDVKAIANNAVANLSTELGITDGTTSGTSTVNLKTEKLKVVGTGVAKTTVNGQTITVDVAKGTLTNNTTTGALTGTAGVVDANDMATAVNTAITKAVDTATGTQKLDISAGGTDNSVNLKTQKLTVAGTGAATASLNNQTITVNVAEGTFTNKSDGTTSATAGVAKATDVAAAINNANSVLGNKITAATQSLSTLGDNKFKLTADSTSTTGQALNKSGGLSFKIAGDGDLVSTSATTDTINVTVKKGTLSTNTDGTINKTADGVVTADNMKTVVNDAITKAVTSAKDGSAWNISTNGGTATKVSGGNTVDLKGGDNIVVEQDSTDGKKITVKTKKDLTLDSVTAANTVKVGSGTNLITLDGTSGAVSGNTFTGTTFTSGAASMNATGFRLTGGPSVTTTGIDAGSAAITNVASGGTTGTNAANIADVKQIAKDTVNNAVTKLSSTLTVTDGTTDGNVSLKTDKLKVVGTGAATANVNGQTITIGVAKGTLTNDTDGKVKSTGTGVATTDEVESTVNNAISKAVTNSTAAVNTLGANTLTLTADSNSTTGQALNQSGGLSFKVAGDGTFISTSAAGDTVTVSVKQGVFGSNADGTAKSTTNGVATTDNVADIVNTTVSNAVNNVTSNQNLKIGGDTTAANSAVNLKNDTLSVKGDNKYISTAASGKDITLTVNEQAIKDAAKDASSFKVKANSTAAEDVKGGDTVTFNNGDNIAITQTGKTFKIATAKNVTFDTATIGTNTTIGSTGITTNKVNVGNISIDGTDGINAGGKAITHVGTGRVANSNADDTNVANIGDVKAIATDAVANLSTNLGITDGTTSGTVNLKNQSLKVVGTGAAKATVNGQTITVDVAKGTLTNNTTTGALTGTAGVVDANDMAAAVNTAITKAVDNATGTQALNLTDGTNTGSVKLSTQTLSVSGTNGVEATVGGQGITIGLDTATKNLISNSSTAVDNLGKNTFTLKADSTDTTAQDLNKSGGLAFKVAGDGNFITTSAATDTVTVSIKQGTFGSNTDGTAKSTTNGVATTDKVADIVNTTVSNAVNNVTSNQNLKIGGDTTAANSAVNLKNDTLSVKGDNKYISTAASGKDITLTVNEQAIKDAAKDASSFKVKANSTAAEDVKGGDTVTFNNGDNIAITQTGKTFKIATAKNVTFDTATIGTNTTIGSTGITTNKVTVGGISIDGTNGINAGSKQITNVASGGTTVTNAANIGDVDTKVTTAINDLTTNLTKNTSISYTANNDTPVKTVSLKDGFKFTNGTLTTAEVAAGGVVKFNVTQGSLSTDSNGNITNTAGVATTDDVKNAVNTAINKAVTNSSTAVNTLGANTFTLKADSTDTTAQNLNKSGGLAFKVAGDGNFITTSAATDTVTVSIKQGTFGSNTDGTAKSTTNGVATTNDVANIVNTTVTNAVTKATGSQVLNITDGNNNGSINLKNDALKVVGADGVTTAVSGKTITVGLDTATKDKINNASTATNKNISLAADTGNASSQSLKDGDVSFAVKGASGDYISTNMNGSTVEISTKRATINSNAATGEASVTGNDGLATAKNVADAINAATAKAVSQSAWKLAADGTTGTETISGGDTVNFKAGSNMEVSRTGKDITYKTKDNVAFTTVTAGTGANEVKLDGNTGTVTAKDITATGDVTAKNVTTSGNVTAAGTVKGDTVQGNTVKGNTVKAGNVTITGGTTNTITGLSNTTWTPAGGIQADRAATEGQLQQAINQVNATVGSTALTFKGDTNPAQSMTLQGNTFAITGDTMIKTTTNTNGIGLSLDTSKVNIAYAANGLNGQTTSLASGLNFTDGDHTKATVAASGVVKYDAKTSTISVANGHATSSGNDLATADNVADAINQMTQNNAGNTTQLRQEISKVATETQRVGAHAAAMAALKPIQYDPLAPTQIMAGVGNYRGESAAALGIAHYTNDNTMFNVGVSVGGNHNMINAGVTHKFGISAEKKNIPDRYKAGPISSIYVMQDEMTQLRSENEAYKAKLDKQQSEIDALKAAVDQLLASKA